jgi:hypothetical protein
MRVSERGMMIIYHVFCIYVKWGLGREFMKILEALQETIKYLSVTSFLINQ